MKLAFFTLTSILLLLVIARPAQAQFQLQGNIGLSIPTSDFGSTDRSNNKALGAKVGGGFESSLRYFFADRKLAVGILGATYLNAADKDFLGVSSYNSVYFTVNAYMALLEYYLLTEGKVRPYLGINLGGATNSFSVSNTNNGVTATGVVSYTSFAVAPVLGIKVPISQSWDFDANLRYFISQFKATASGDKAAVQFIPISVGLAYNFGR